MSGLSRVDATIVPPAAAASPCQSCAACCSYSREWPRFATESDADIARIPAEFVDDRRGRMRCSGDRLLRPGGRCRRFDRMRDRRGSARGLPVLRARGRRLSDGTPEVRLDANLPHRRVRVANTDAPSSQFAFQFGESPDAPHSLESDCNDARRSPRCRGHLRVAGFPRHRFRRRPAGSPHAIAVGCARCLQQGRQRV